ncbi:ROK family transcriptional regulator [Actinoplanes sp. TFC3]|uniref:ROK family transcriptional regulator n=1 Tax=Actinoplanes sp. TFC3 TaxID=1710355 RepID=UPI00082EF7E7|nr:ROK family transcriptional regulator [Actinoplanes sp. TFC3]
MDLARSMTDETVLRALMQHRRLTRAELAAHTGISKPTAGESVRRLSAAGLLADTGERTPGGRGKGRVGSYYALTPDAGTALAVSIGPSGAVAEQVDAYGDTVARARRPLRTPTEPEAVAAALHELTALAGPLPRLAVVSAADPVDRRTGRLRKMPDAPFLLGDLDPVAVLSPYVAGPITVDNDVNWAARAERDATEGRTDFAYLHLGVGLGGAVVSDGEVRRGHGGLAGELAHLVTTGPNGDATGFIQVFGELGLRLPGSTAIDTARLLAAVTGDDPDASATRSLIARAVAGVVAAVVALTDPAEVILGGSWGPHPAILDAVSAVVARQPRPVPLHAATVTAEPSLTGARTDAITRLRTAIITASQPPGPAADAGPLSQAGDRWVRLAGPAGA